MKTALSILLLLVSALYSFSQKKPPAFEQIDPEDLAMKSCDIDPQAEAYKLLDLGDVTYTRGRNFLKMNMERRVRIKILKEKGIELANVKIPFYSMRNYERITDISAVTYNAGPDG